MRSLRLALLVPLAVGCSILDPGDRDELRNQIAMMSPSDKKIYKRWLMNFKAQQWLEPKKEENDQIAKVQCRDDEGGAWSEWYDRPDKVYSVQDMLNCLIKKPRYYSYLECIDESMDYVVPDAKKELLGLLPAGTDVDCRYVWDPRYEPEKVDPKIVDPDAITPDDLIEAMIALPGPLPGAPLPQFAPLLCPLGAGPGWGCPPRPSDTIPTGGETTDPTGGDHR